VIGRSVTSGLLSRRSFRGRRRVVLTGFSSHTSGGIDGRRRAAIHATAVRTSRLTLNAVRLPNRVLSWRNPARGADERRAGRKRRGSGSNWLPQETILFNALLLRRKLDVDLC